MDTDPGGPKNHVDPVDPDLDSDSDPEHCNKQSKILGVINKMANVKHLAGLSSCSVLQYTMLQLSICGQVRHCTIENSQAGPSTAWVASLLCTVSLGDTKETN